MTRETGKASIRKMANHRREVRLRRVPHSQGPCAQGSTPLLMDSMNGAAMKLKWLRDPAFNTDGRLCHLAKAELVKGKEG